MKLGKSDLIYIDCIDKLVEIDDTLILFIDLSKFLPISSIYIGIYHKIPKISPSKINISLPNR